jgi:energy-coupling factor transport system substrate-specific component
MRWQLAVFSLLALVLVAGIAWYERSRPNSRMVALVAALAALAVASRLVLAPIPNVVGTTDVAFITGYALGGAPGFAVGALAAPVSNFWLGQGPWTPWQMAGWGLTGVAGAGLAVLTRRRLGRLGLATACALAGLAYGALLDLSVMVGYGGEQSLDRYLALSARGVPFNVAHALGNFALAMAAGPALVRMISRYRTRLEFTWRPAGVAAVVAAMALAGATSPAPRAAASGADARAWLERAQRSDGGYAASADIRSSPQMTGWAMLGLEAAGRNPLDVSAGGRSPVDYLRERVDRLGRGLGDLELAILGLEGAGRDARAFAGHDLAADLARRQGGDGSFAGQVNLTAYGALALSAAGRGADANQALGWIRAAQNADGGWGTNRGARSEPDSTGSAIQAIGLAHGAGVMQRGVRYLRRVQQPAGGWGLYETGITNSQSTAFAVMGLVAAGLDPARVRHRGHSGMTFLAARQAGDGHYAYSSASDQTPVWVTAQALLAVSREALPIEPVPRSPSGAVEPDPDVASPPAPAAHTTAEAAPVGTRHPRGQRHMVRHSNPEGASGSERPGQDDRSAAERTPTTALAVPASQSAPAEAPSGSDTAIWVAGGFGALILVLAGGFVLYRRSLP